MKQSRIRGILAGAAAVALVGGTVAPALANTELVPASRLVAPFLDISSGRDTFYLLVNVSQDVSLNRSTYTTAGGVTRGPWGVHLEHYGQSCDRVDESVSLTQGDIDQLDLLVNSVARTTIGAGQALGAVTPSATQSGVAGRGWTDIDVRFGTGTLTGSTSIQANVLLGTTIISDLGSDFAFAYPMAAMIGTSNNTSGHLGTPAGPGSPTNGSIGGKIVTRAATGTAAAWTGRYEPLPRRVFVPIYFADGTQASTGETFNSFLAVAGPPDGNWDGSNDGEAPGQSTGKGLAGPPNLTLNLIVWDGCEDNTSFNYSSHFLNNTYAGLFGTTTNRSTWQTTVPTSCHAVFASRDDLSGQALGWIDIINTAQACDNTANGIAGCPTGPGTGAGTGTGYPRGMAGINVTNVVSSSEHMGDVTRLWGDASPWGIVADDGSAKATLCFNGVKCFYSLVDQVNHVDTSQNGVLTNLNSVSEN